MSFTLQGLFQGSAWVWFWLVQSQAPVRKEGQEIQKRQLGRRRKGGNADKGDEQFHLQEWWTVGELAALRVWHSFSTRTWGWISWEKWLHLFNEFTWGACVARKGRVPTPSKTSLAPCRNEEWSSRLGRGTGLGIFQQSLCCEGCCMMHLRAERSSTLPWAVALINWINEWLHIVSLLLVVL